MKLLAFDLSYVDPTGWVFWQDDRADPVVAYGEFKTRNSGAGAERDLKKIRDFSDNVMDLVERYVPDIVVYEITDWFRNLKNSNQFEVDYKIERVTQRSLGKAEICFLVALSKLKDSYSQVKVHSYGVGQVREEFGAKSKIRVAELFSQEYPRFTVKRGDKEWHLYDAREKVMLSDHISDAFALAKVFSNRLRFDSLIQEAEHA